MRSVILANGIHTDGEGSIDLLGAELRRRGVRVLAVLLPKRSVISARWGARRDARALAQVSAPGDVIVGHSFGCLRAARAAELVEYSAIVCIAPAMPASWKWADPWRVSCFHSCDDLALRAARMLLAHPFGGGSAGLEGFPGAFNVNCDGAGHSDYFVAPLLERVANHVFSLVRD